jgi:hypothetical protein
MHLVLKILLYIPIFLIIFVGLTTKQTAGGQSRFKIFLLIILKELPKLIVWYVILVIIYLIAGYSMIQDLSPFIKWITSPFVWLLSIIFA